MIYLFICILIGLILGIVEAVKYGEIIDFLASFVVCTLVGTFLTFIIGVPVGLALDKEEAITEEKLVSVLSTSQEDKFLYVENNGNEIKYKYATEGEKGLEVKDENLMNICVIESDNSPVLIKHTSEFKKPWYWLFGIKMSEEYNEFFVPKNSIIYSFK